jgi:hypothetical protein
MPIPSFRDNILPSIPSFLSSVIPFLPSFLPSFAADSLVVEVLRIETMAPTGVPTPIPSVAPSGAPSTQTTAGEYEQNT